MKLLKPLLLRSPTGTLHVSGHRRRLIAVVVGEGGQSRLPPLTSYHLRPSSAPFVSSLSSFAGATRKSSSSAAAVTPEFDNNTGGPSGDLFVSTTTEAPRSMDYIGPQLVGRSGQIERTFGPSDNAQALLVTGGEALAAHASFDPDYQRARSWIHNHAVGPASLSGPVLVSGLIGALVEAAFPQAVPRRHSMEQVRPLIVGVAVKAHIQVRQASHTMMAPQQPQDDDAEDNLLGKLQQQQRGDADDNGVKEKRYGYEVTLDTKVVRVRDDTVIAKGEHVVWIPDYHHM